MKNSRSQRQIVDFLLDMPYISGTGYRKQQKTILDILGKHAQEEMKEAGIRLCKTLQVQDKAISDNSLLDVAVSFDGTWAKRGFTSMTGVVFVISVDTGEVLDSDVLSKTCEQCKQWEHIRDTEPQKYHEWKVSHIRSGSCDINFEGSSSAMEAKGAETLFARSIELHNMRYRWMVSDGDSMAFTRVNESNVYSGDCKVEKVDCVGHVQKRMGKHLKTLRQNHKGKLSDGKAVGGRGHRLNDPDIDKLQRYYGYAIRQNAIKHNNPTEEEVNEAVQKIKTAVKAAMHLASRTRILPHSIGFV